MRYTKDAADIEDAAGGGKIQGCFFLAGAGSHSIVVAEQGLLSQLQGVN